MSEIHGHLEFEQLLLLVDESAPARSTRAARRHVAGCWKCRYRLDELQDAVREFARYHEKVVLPNLPAPPAPWPDLRRRMEKVDESSQIPKLWQRASEYFSLPALPVKRLILGFAVLGCCVVAFTLAAKKKHAEKPVTKPAEVATPRKDVSAEPLERHSTVAPAASRLPKHIAIDPEVQVFLALHDIQADLGDPVEVSRDSSGKIKIAGIGLPPARQAEIRDAVSEIPDLLVTWHDSAEVGESRLRRAKPIHLEAAQSPLEARLRQFPGGPSDWESYSNRVLDESDAILARAHALGTLEEHFPDSRRARMQPSDLETLDRMSAEHRAALHDHLRRLKALLAPIREILNAPAPEPSATRLGLLAAAQRMDSIVSVIFGGAATIETPSQLLAGLLQASTDLNAAAGGNE
jgi:hypothetical protein